MPNYSHRTIFRVMAFGWRIGKIHTAGCGGLGKSGAFLFNDCMNYQFYYYNCKMKRLFIAIISAIVMIAVNPENGYGAGKIKKTGGTSYVAGVEDSGIDIAGFDIASIAADEPAVLDFGKGESLYTSGIPLDGVKIADLARCRGPDMAGSNNLFS